ncbi:hypothetical protein [Microbulbifer guangxiensis]|uniref:hypothetical protein n=1 Tax=Microbulbifer guangxiensis TaxID=2904249 RepID=UPI001F1C9440|nr:hypothetical protein [Microbulbifer guangxiensis]
MTARIWLLGIAVFLIGVVKVQAQSISPTRLEIDIEQSPRAVLTISSTKSVDVALELSASAYFPLVQEQAIPLEVSPPQLLLQAGETRQVVVSWVGREKLPKSVSYYLAIDELALEVGDASERAEIRLLTSWRLPVHIEAGGLPEVDFTPPDIDGSASLELTNTGEKYALLSNYQVTFDSGGELQVFDGLQFARLINRDAILPGQTVSVPLRLIGIGAEGLQGAQLVRKE